MSQQLQNIKDNYKHVAEYDCFTQSLSKKDLPFWVEMIGRLDATHILELACGSGRIGLELLRQHKKLCVEGLDVSEEMLAAYRAKLDLAPDEMRQRATLHLRDMSTYQLEHKGRFDLIFVANHSLGLLLETQQQLDAFRKTYEHLAPGGHFVVDSFVPALNEIDGSTLSLSQVCDMPDENCRLVVYGAIQYDRYTQTCTIQNISERFFSSGSSKRYFTQFKTYLFSPSELQLLFLNSGFSIEAIYGNYSWLPFGEGDRQIVIGRKPTK